MMKTNNSDIVSRFNDQDDREHSRWARSFREYQEVPIRDIRYWIVQAQNNLESPIHVHYCDGLHFDLNISKDRTIIALSRKGDYPEDEWLYFLFFWPYIMLPELLKVEPGHPNSPYPECHTIFATWETQMINPWL